MATVAHRRRAAPRAELAVDVKLTRPHGSAVHGRTHDLGASGMRVACNRPLSLDEHLEFDLAMAAGTHVAGHAHVVREHAYAVYALRFDALDATACARLSAVAGRPHGDQRP